MERLAWHHLPRRFLNDSMMSKRPRLQHNGPSGAPQVSRPFRIPWETV